MAALRQIGLWPLDQAYGSCWTRDHPDKTNLPIVFSLNIAMAAFWRVKSFEFRNEWTGSVYTNLVGARTDRAENGEPFTTEFQVSNELDLMRASVYLRHVGGEAIGIDGQSVTRDTGIHMTFLNDINPVFPIVSIAAGIQLPPPYGAQALRVSTSVDGNATELDPQIGVTSFRLFDYAIEIPMYGSEPDEAAPPGNARFRGAVSGMTEEITLQATTAGAIGNAISLVFDGQTTIGQAVDLWNESHEDNTVSLSGNPGQIPNDGQYIALSGGYEGHINYVGFVRPFEFWEYDPQDGDGPIYDKYTGSQLRDFPFYY
mgnify:CR=1 FL=1